MADDRIVYHIEVSTEETNELKEARNALGEIEKKIYTIKSSRRGRELFENPELFDFGAPVKSEEDRGPIFRGEEEAEGVAQIQRPGKKGQAIQRMDAFKNLVGRMDDLEEGQSKMNQVILGIGSASSILTGGMGNFIKGWVLKNIPFIGDVLIASGVLFYMFDKMLGPGGAWDRRFKRVLQNEQDNFTSREKKAKIRQGLVDIRMSSWIGNKGATRGQVGTTLQKYRSADLYAQTPLERLAKGVE